MTALFVWLHVQLAEVRARVDADGERGEVLEKAVIVAGCAAIAAAVVAAISAAVDVKIGALQL